MSKIRNYILWTIAILFVLSLVFNARTCQTSVGVVSDTTRVTIYDTIKVVKPIPKDSTVVRYVTEVVKVVDTELVTDCHQMDSANVVIPITQKVYEDSTYTAYVSGYKASLDSIFLYPKTEVRTINIKPKPKRWGIGVQVGYGLTLQPQPKFAPYVGVGISYNIFNF